jgi:hypothetical protein
VEQQRPPVHIERVAGSNRSSAVGVVIVSLAVLLLVAKPWVAAQPPRSSPPATAAAAVEQPPSPAAATLAQPSPNAELAAALGRRQCQNPAVWRVVTRERTGSVETRSLFPIDPVVARGPTDPAIRAATIHASQLLGIGYCIPLATDPDVAAIEHQILIWTRSSAGLYSALKDPRVQDQALFNLGEAYLAPPIGAPAATWPGGRYVFEVQPSRAGGTARWFALDFAPSD